MEVNKRRLRNHLAKELLHLGVRTDWPAIYETLDEYLGYAMTVGYEAALDEWKAESIPPKHPLDE